MSTEFAGFGPSFFGFFEEIAANNKREWFEANKDRYKSEVVGPLTLVHRGDGAPPGQDFRPICRRSTSERRVDVPHLS